MCLRKILHNIYKMQRSKKPNRWNGVHIGEVILLKEWDATVWDDAVAQYESLRALLCGDSYIIHTNKNISAAQLATASVLGFVILKI